MRRKVKEEHIPHEDKAVLCTIEVLKRIKSTHTAAKVAWPDEGEIRGESFVFNEECRGKFVAMTIDSMTANMLVTIHDALNPTNKEKFASALTESRGTFMYWAQEGWKLVK